MQKLPKKLYDIINAKYDWFPVNHGNSQSQIFFLKHSDKINLYLKINQKNLITNLEDEYRRLNWLEGRIPVPKTIVYLKESSLEYLLLTEINGTPSFKFENENREKIIKMLASGLKTIHSIPIYNCPFDQSLNNQLIRVKEIIRQKLVNTDNFDDERKGKTIDQLYNELIETRPSSEDLVFTHGDYCLPNVLINNFELSGFIDLGRSGIADRYQDLALCARSIICNFHDPELVSTFFGEYGIDTIDEDKLRFYQLLDEFF